MRIPAAGVPRGDDSGGLAPIRCRIPDRMEYQRMPARRSSGLRRMDLSESQFLIKAADPRTPGECRRLYRGQGSAHTKGPEAQRQK